MHDNPVERPTPDRLAVVIEIKGPWNRDLMTAQRDQLATRYLPETQSTNGIYLVGWYPMDLWTYEADYRRRNIRHIQRRQLLDDLEEQATMIHVDLAVHTRPLLLDVPRPHRLVDADPDVLNCPDGPPAHP
jgi:hypothetical protein